MAAANPTLPAPLSLPRGTSERLRFWTGGAAALMLFLSAAFAWSQYSLFGEHTARAAFNRWPDGRSFAGDYVQFAAVATAWRGGGIDRLYESLDRQRGLMTAALGNGPPYQDTLSYNYPPFHAWLLRPLAGCSYPAGFCWWTALHAAFAVAALWLWRGWLAPGAWGFAALAVWLSPPAVASLMLGHQAFLHLLAFTLAWHCLDRRRDFAAGLAVSLLLYKPTLGIVIGPVLLLKGRWRALGGVAAGGALLAAASWAASPQACRDYRGMGRELLRLAADTPDYFAKHFTWLGAVANLSRKTPAAFGAAEWLAVGVPMLSAALLLAWAWRGRWQPGTDAFARAASATMLATFFVTPYAFAYDLASLGVAGALTLRTLPRRPAWHAAAALSCWTVAMFAAGGNNTLLDGIDAATGWRWQPAPFALLAWLALEALAGPTRSAARLPGSRSRD